MTIEPPQARRPLLVAIEGIDGAGKSAAIPLIAALLRARGIDVYQVADCAPSTPLGAALRTERGIRARHPGDTCIDRHNGGACAALSPQPFRPELYLAAAACRAVEARTLVEGAMLRGGVVLLDRYVQSSMAYAVATAGIANLAWTSTGIVDWVAEINATSRRADLSIVLSLPVVEALRRLHERGRELDLFEVPRVLGAAADAYTLNQIRNWPRHGTSFVNADQRVADVATEAAAMIASVAENAVEAI